MGAQPLFRALSSEVIVLYKHLLWLNNIFLSLYFDCIFLIYLCLYPLENINFDYYIFINLSYTLYVMNNYIDDKVEELKKMFSDTLNKEEVGAAIVIRYSSGKYNVGYPNNLEKRDEIMQKSENGKWYLTLDPLIENINKFRSSKEFDKRRFSIPSSLILVENIVEYRRLELSEIAEYLEK